MADGTDDGRAVPGTAEQLTTRRRLLVALGTAAMPAVAGCSSSSNSSTDTPTATETSPTETMQPTTTPQQTQQAQQAQEPSIHPRFGYVGTGDETPPVEPDHRVQCLIRPRQNAPIPEFYFEPTGLLVEPGDVVRFDMATPHHNVNAYHPAFGYTQRVPDGAPPYSSPILSAGDYWLYRFETEGVHNIMCAPHELFGMVGSVVVGSATGPATNAVGEAPAPSQQSRPPEYTAALVLSDPALEPENIVQNGPIAWSDLASESKRPLLRPVEE
jgi:plastocyanin